MRYVSLSRLLAEIRESMPATDAQAMAIALYAIFWRLVPLAALVWVLVLVVGPRHSQLMVVALAVNALPFSAFLFAFPFVVAGAWQHARGEMSTLPVAFFWYGLRFALGRPPVARSASRAVTSEDPNGSF